MVLSTIECICLTLGVCGGVHLLVAFIDAIETQKSFDDADYSNMKPVMKELTKNKVDNDFEVETKDAVHPFFH